MIVGHNRQHPRAKRSARDGIQCSVQLLVYPFVSIHVAKRGDTVLDLDVNITDRYTGTVTSFQDHCDFRCYMHCS